MSRPQMIERHKDGFGCGDGVGYKAWIGLGSFPSKGVSHRQIGRLTGRHHHLFSNHELRVFLAAQRLSKVVDIREQFPLWPLEATEDIARDLGVRHPGPSASQPQVMTTDLFLTLRDGSYEAIAVKPAKDLSDLRTLEKLEIERLYWKERGINWSIVTEREISSDLVDNLIYMDECHVLPDNCSGEHDIDDVEMLLFQALMTASTVSLSGVCLKTDAELKLDEGTCLTIARRAFALKHWSIPMHIKLDPSQPLIGLVLGPNSLSKVRKSAVPQLHKIGKTKSVLKTNVLPNQVKEGRK